MITNQCVGHVMSQQVAHPREGSMPTVSANT